MTLGKSLEDYLETILILKIKKGMVRSIDVADYMRFSKPSVSHAVKQLKTQGFLLMDNNGQLLLTDSGQAMAEKIYERHCFFTKYFTEMGVDPKLAESDACKLEHVISDESFLTVFFWCFSPDQKQEEKKRLLIHSINEQGHKALANLGVAPYFLYLSDSVGQSQSLLPLVHGLDPVSYELL